MREHKYILEGHKAVPCSDLWKWSEQCERGHTTDRDLWRVAKTMLGEIMVSTVFLGIDHGWNYDGPPILFETMIFGFPEGHPLHDYQERCSTWEEAEAMHASAVAQATQELTNG